MSSFVIFLLGALCAGGLYVVGLHVFRVLAAVLWYRYMTKYWRG